MTIIDTQEYVSMLRELTEQGKKLACESLEIVCLHF